MIGLGIRASAKSIFYSVIEKKEDSIDLLTVSHLIVPQSLSIPDRLNFIRANFLSIIKEYDVSVAGIRISEITSPKSNVNSFIERLNIEGVIQELLSDCDVKKYFICRKQNIASILEEDVKVITEYIEGKECYGIKLWDTYTKEQRESILTSICSLYVK